MKYTCIDGFSGAGGLSLGLKRAGFDIIYSFDFDEDCVTTLSKNKKYLDHAIHREDINNLLKGVLLSKAKIKKGELFLLAGGPPCQGFSIQRIGADLDERNNLVLKYAQLIGEVYPYFFVMENVAGIRGKRGKMILDKFLEMVRSFGYTVHSKLLDAQDYGVPQRRKRMILIGERSDIGKEYLFPIPRQKKVTVRDAIGSLPPPPENGSDYPSMPLHRRDKLSDVNIKRLKILKPGQGRDSLPRNLLANCHKFDSSAIGHRNVYGRMLWDEVAPTITARFDSFTRGMFGHPEQLRSISLREGALLQTFPKDFIFSGTKVSVARQIGNAVPVKFAEAIGRSIIRYYNKRK
jgi:DNA (cytosine-5)-methyltransferase 1